MRVISVIIAAAAAVIVVDPAVAMPDLSVRQPVRAADGYEDVIAWGTVPIGDKDVANKAMPKLNDCLKKARKTAK